MEKHNPKTASIVVLRPAVARWLLWLATPPLTQDLPNANRDHFRNNALAFVYESGSVMKPLIAGAAVADGHATWGTRIFVKMGFIPFALAVVSAPLRITPIAKVAING